MFLEFLHFFLKKSMNNKKNIFSCMAGNIIEWYEFTIYGYLSTTLGILFFPQESSFAQVLSSFSIFAVGFIARPFGGIILGWIGDKFGRRLSLLISMYIGPVDIYR